MAFPYTTLWIIVGLHKVGYRVDESKYGTTQNSLCLGIAVSCMLYSSIYTTWEGYSMYIWPKRGSIHLDVKGNVRHFQGLVTVSYEQSTVVCLTINAEMAEDRRHWHVMIQAGTLRSVEADR